MLYRIADINLEMPAFGDMPERMLQYELSAGKVDMGIMETDLLLSRWEDLQDINLMYYMETCQAFYTKLLQFQGMMLHMPDFILSRSEKRLKSSTMISLHCAELMVCGMHTGLRGAVRTASTAMKRQRLQESVFSEEAIRKLQDLSRRKRSFI